MRSTLKWLAVLLVLAVATTAWAQDGEKPEGRRGARLAEGIKKLDLPAETEEQVLGILKTHRQAAENWRSEHGEEFKELREAMRAAKEAGDTDKLAELREQAEKLMAGRKELHEQLMSQLDDVLTDEQMADVKKLFRPRKGRGHRGPGMFLRGLDLSDEQQAQVKAILSEAEQQAEAAETPEAKKEIMQAARKKIHDEVLTEEQQAKAEAMRKELRHRKGAGMFLRGLDLTEEQQAQVKGIMAEAKKKGEAAETPETKKEIMKAARKKVFDEVLTDEQREKAEKRRDARRGGRKGRRGHGGGDSDE
ncbi:MAG: hypothetical protein ACYS8X_07520 [Planctomycetota bacterium]|jgi:Spy/CpxP family protein refolding chaperone